MIYTCCICEYKTTRAFDYDRHTKRKLPCKLKSGTFVTKYGNNPTDQNINPTDPNINPTDPNINPTDPNINPTDPNINPTDPNINPKYKCSKCNKEFSRNQRLNEHYLKCDGLDKRQCKICLRLFTTPQGKWKHMQYVKCNPPQQIINHNTTNINNIHITNNNQQYITNIRLSFGNEDVSGICNESGYMKRIEECVKMLKYAIPRSLEDVFFNDNYPENQTVKKDRRNDDLINVHIGDGKWENRLAKDTIDGILNTIQNYMEKYINTAKLNPVARSRLKVFGKEMSKVKDWSTEAIEDRLAIEPYEDADEEEMKKSTNSLSKLIKAKIYEETRTSI